MSELTPRARKIVEQAISADGPNQAEREGVRARLVARLGAAALAGSAVASAGAASAAVASNTANTAASSALGAGAATSASKTVLTSGLLAKLTLAVAVTGAVGIGAVAIPWEKSTDSADKQTASNGAGQAVEPQTAKPEQRSQALDTEPGPAERKGETTAAAVKEKRSTKAIGAKTVPDGRTDETRDRLNAELNLLRTAQSALQQGRPDQALKALDAHARMFPRGAMQQEREAARAVSLCALGRLDEGREVARRLLAESPRSPLARRMSRACALGRRP